MFPLGAMSQSQLTNPMFATTLEQGSHKSQDSTGISIMQMRKLRLRVRHPKAFCVSSGIHSIQMTDLNAQLPLKTQSKIVLLLLSIVTLVVYIGYLTLLNSEKHFFHLEFGMSPFLDATGAQQLGLSFEDRLGLGICTSLMSVSYLPQLTGHEYLQSGYCMWRRPESVMEGTEEMSVLTQGQGSWQLIFLFLRILNIALHETWNHCLHFIPQSTTDCLALCFNPPATLNIHPQLPEKSNLFSITQGNQSIYKLLAVQPCSQQHTFLLNTK